MGFTKELTKKQRNKPPREIPLSTNIEVRIASKADTDELIAMNHEFNDVKVDSQWVQESLDTNLQHEIVAIAYVGHRAVGFACGQVYSSFCYDSLCGEITEMYVRKTHRRQGVGSALLVFLEQTLQTRGVTSIKILTGQKNRGAQKLYTRLGYREIDEVVLLKE
ncbi:MAG: GNAT family N-acetyltransferase [Firmicutes bacterium]|nr:GNAT family N-acetyltransferase [Bacillota bacterium]